MLRCQPRGLRTPRPVRPRCLPRRQSARAPTVARSELQRDQMSRGRRRGTTSAMSVGQTPACPVVSHNPSTTAPTSADIAATNSPRVRSIPPPNGLGRSTRRCWGPSGPQNNGSLESLRRIASASVSSRSTWLRWTASNLSHTSRIKPVGDLRSRGAVRWTPVRDDGVPIASLLKKCGVKAPLPEIQHGHVLPDHRTKSVEARRSRNRLGHVRRLVESRQPRRLRKDRHAQSVVPGPVGQPQQHRHQPRPQ